MSYTQHKTYRFPNNDMAFRPHRKFKGKSWYISTDSALVKILITSWYYAVRKKLFWDLSYFRISFRTQHGHYMTSTRVQGVAHIMIHKDKSSQTCHRSSITLYSLHINFVLPTPHRHRFSNSRSTNVFLVNL